MLGIKEPSKDRMKILEIQNRIDLDIHDFTGIYYRGYDYSIMAFRFNGKNYEARDAYRYILKYFKPMTKKDISEHLNSVRAKRTRDLDAYDAIADWFIIGLENYTCWKMIQKGYTEQEVQTAQDIYNADNAWKYRTPVFETIRAIIE